MDARTDGTVVWELQPDDLNSWSDVIKGTLDTETGYVKVNGNFLAGISCSMDVKGRGENLKLLLYSVDKSGMSNFKVHNYKLHEHQELHYSSPMPYPPNCGKAVHYQTDHRKFLQ